MVLVGVLHCMPAVACSIRHKAGVPMLQGRIISETCHGCTVCYFNFLLFVGAPRVALSMEFKAALLQGPGASCAQLVRVLSSAGPGRVNVALCSLCCVCFTRVNSIESWVWVLLVLESGTQSGDADFCCKSNVFQHIRAWPHHPPFLPYFPTHLPPSLFLSLPFPHTRTLSLRAPLRSPHSPPPLTND
eukprot:1147486-Pelagomonas_calceolata.AAC.3